MNIFLMIAEKKKYIKFRLSLILLCTLLMVYAFIYFSKVSNDRWVPAGDTFTSLAVYSYQYSAIARGEYPCWNPLVRSGESGIIHQAFNLASPSLNLVAIISVLLGVEDIVLSFSIYCFFCIVAYVIGVYLLVSCWVRNSYASVFSSALALGSSSVFFFSYTPAFINILHTLPWILYAITMYLRKFRFKYLLILILSFCIALYTYELVFGLSYLVLLAIAVLIFYRKQVLIKLYLLKTLPPWHYIIFGSLLLIVALPQAFIYINLKEDLLPISRASNISVTNDYVLT